MLKEATEMARLLKERENKTFESIAIGKVVSLSPLKVNDGDEIILDEELIVTRTIQQLITTSELKIGNRVVMIANEDYSKYVVIDKVVS